MDLYKQYILQLRNLSLNDPYIILKDDIAPKLKHYIRLLNEIKFEDGSYHAYYGEIKKILNSFTDNWTEVMDEAIKEADRCSHIITREQLIQMMEKTISMQQDKQEDFDRQFLPINNDIEDVAYKDIQEKYEAFMKALFIFKDELNKLDKQDKIDAFVKEQFPISLHRKNEIFAYTYNFISYKLTLSMDRIRVSLEEILNRLRNNVRTMEEMSEVNISHLLIRLYEKNKEHLTLSRQDIRSTVELAEVQRSMEKIKDKIEDSKHIPIERMKEEFNYWDGKMNEFQQIQKTLKHLNQEEEKLLEQEKLFHDSKDTDLQAPNWEEMEEQFKKKLNEISELKMNAAKTLLTFFSVRGPDRIYYADKIGTYFVDEYGHQCYVFDYGLKIFHVNCEGDFIDVQENVKYFYDNMGRFIVNDDGEKMYQVAPCTSTYKIQNDLFIKMSKDCGHSEESKANCRMTIKDPTEEVNLPDIQPVDIKGRLDSKMVKYLWDTFGHVLPQVLCDVAETKPKNPIQHIAHNLLTYKYNTTPKQLQKNMVEAVKYRNKIHQDRIENIVQKRIAWKAKQVKRRKPEESDDTEGRFVYDTYKAQQDFIRSLENYNV